MFLRSLRPETRGCWPCPARPCEASPPAGRWPAVPCSSPGPPARPGPFTAAYTVSGQALTAYADVLRMEYGTRLRVTTVYPGYVDTPIHDRSRAAGVALDGLVPASAFAARCSRSCGRPPLNGSRATRLPPRWAPELLDHLQRESMAGESPGPLTRAMSRIHVTGEARHMRYAREEPLRVWPGRGPLTRAQPDGPGSCRRHLHSPPDVTVAIIFSTGFHVTDFPVAQRIYGARGRSLAEGGFLTGRKATARNGLLPKAAGAAGNAAGRESAAVLSGNDRRAPRWPRPRYRRNFCRLSSG
jgi:hypothetical protein